MIMAFQQSTQMIDGIQCFELIDSSRLEVFQYLTFETPTAIWAMGIDTTTLSF